MRVCSEKGLEDHFQVKEIGSGASQRRRRDILLEATRRREIDVILVWVRDRLASIVRGLFEIRDHSNHLGIEVVCWREQLYTDGPLGRAGLVIVSAVFKLERSLIVERVQAR